MYIKMEEDKNLIITVPTSIYQGESNAGSICFLLPQIQEDVKLADCAVFMRYILPDNTGRSEALHFEPETYRGYLKYTTLASTKFTAISGIVKIWIIAMNDTDMIVLKTGEVDVEILPSRSIGQYLPPESLEQIDQLTLQVKALQKTKADNIVFHKDNHTIQLTANGAPIGDQIVVSSGSGEDTSIQDMKISAEGHLMVYFMDGTVKDLGNVVGKDGSVYVPHIDAHKMLTFTIEESPGDVPPPTDLNSSDEWGSIDDSTIQTDYVWETL